MVQKIIIDTDPGVDDTLAMLLALSASPEELEVVMLSVTYGNVPLKGCAKNVVALFHVIKQEMEWRKSVGRDEGFAALKAHKPIVALGPEHPLEEDELKADFFHGLDGLHNVHTTYPELAPVENWERIFEEHAAENYPDDCIDQLSFTPSAQPSHKEILRILKENPIDTVSILAVGPLTNVALAAAEDPETLIRAKEVVVMGGAIHVEGNVTPVAEFNTYADAVASARVFALTSLTPKATMPAKTTATTLPDYPEKLSRRLKIVLCPLDITCKHEITRNFFVDRIQPTLDAGSPLAKWLSHFLHGAFTKVQSSWEGDSGLALHDPFTVWYMMAYNDPKWKFVPNPEDIRIETTGQWTRGMHVADCRGKRRPAEDAVAASRDPLADPEIVALDTVPGDDSAWLSVLKGNRVHRIIGSPGEDLFKAVVMDRIFGESKQLA